ncbi:MAG: superoxide dismutase [Gammaproteobacteria bacterium]|nr:superoxide dismutase [Gammaproteobacteria bacterium]
MSLELPALPYDRTALEPHLSAGAVDLHRGAQRAHLERLQALVADTPFAQMPLEEIARKAQGAMAECAAQVWATTLYWEGLRPPAAGGAGPEGSLAQALETGFGGVEGLRERLARAALRRFGPGWAWLLQRPDGRLAIAVTPHSTTPLTGPDRALLACSLWEHAYVIDYREDRGKYLDAYWQLVDWGAVAARMAPAPSP